MLVHRPGTLRGYGRLRPTVNKGVTVFSSVSAVRFRLWAPPSAFRWCKSRESKQETRLVRVFCCLGFITPSRKPNHAWPSDSTWSPLTASRQNTPPALNHRLNGIRPRPPEIGSDSLDTRPAIGFNEKALWQAALPWVNLRAFGLLAKVTDRDARTIRAPSRSAPHPSPE